MSQISCCRCKVLFVPTTRKTCDVCWEKARKAKMKYNASAKGKAKNKEYAAVWFKTSTGIKSSRKSALRYAKTECGSKKRQEYKQSPAGKLSMKKYRTGPKGKARDKRAQEAINNDPGRKMMHHIGGKLAKMLHHGWLESGTVNAKTQFTSNEDVRQHFESTFSDGMTFQNHGKEEDSWNIGHRIAISMYNQNNEIDMKNSWSRMNLFAQWKTENLRLAVKLPCDEELLRLKSIWPVSWNGILPDAMRSLKLEKAAHNKVNNGPKRKM